MIYTDKIHLVATSLKELHSFAEKIGINRCYYEGYKKGHPHYDLIRKWMYEAAVKKGAVLVSSKEIILFFKKGTIQSSYKQNF